MILAIGIWDDYYWAVEVNDCDPNLVALSLFNSPENGSGCYPDHVILIQDNTIIRQYCLGVEYTQ